MKLKEINSKEAKKYKLIGQAFGINLSHCIKEGKTHCSDFEKRAKYYVIKLDINAEENLNIKFLTNFNKIMIVEFYE